MRRAAHRALDKALAAITPADGATPYRPAPKTAEPPQYFPDPGPPEEFEVERVRRRRVGGQLASIRRIAFDSPVRTDVPANDRVRGFWLTPRERAVRASIVFLHRWRAPVLRPMGRASGIALRAGAQLLIPAHPYHGWRRPRMTYSGINLLSPDLALSLRAMRQAVLDVRRLLSWLQLRGEGPILLVGVDVGGLVAALAATVHEGLSGLVLVASHDRLADMLWQGGVDKGRFRGALERAGCDRATLDDAWEVLDPGWRRPLLDRENILLVGGRYDDAAEPEGIERLARRWGGVEVSWHDFAHGSAMLAASAVMREGLALLELDG